MPDLSVEIAGVDFKNPIVASSCPPTKDARRAKRAIRAGCGGIVMKSVTVDPWFTKYPYPWLKLLHWERRKEEPRWTPKHFAFYSRGLMFTPDQLTPHITETRGAAREAGCVLIGSIMGYTLEDWANLAQTMDEEVEVDMVECNLGCPHPQEWTGEAGGKLAGSNPRIAGEVIKSVREKCSVPVIAKLTPETGDMVAVAEAVRGAGADAVTVMNRFLGLKINIETGMPELGGFAGIGGPWMKPLTLRWISKIAQSVGIPILGNNGAMNGRDAVEFMMAGARAVQFCTTILVNGYGVIGKIKDEISEFMERMGYGAVDEFIGVALKHVVEYRDIDKLPVLVAEVMGEKCDGCARCVSSCFYDAIKIIDKKATVEPESCVGCRYCEQLCPHEAISMRVGERENYLRALEPKM